MPSKYKFVARARKKRSAFVRLVFHLVYSTSKVILNSTFVYNITETLTVTDASVTLFLSPTLFLSLSLARSLSLAGEGTRGVKPQGEHEKRGNEEITDTAAQERPRAMLF